MANCYRRQSKSGFDVFVTTDQNLKYQQNLAGRTIAIVVLLSHIVAKDSTAHSRHSAGNRWGQCRGDYVEVPITECDVPDL